MVVTRWPTWRQPASKAKSPSSVEVAQRGMSSALAGNLVGELEQLDQARFAPAAKGAAELEQLVSQTSAVLKDLERFTPKASG